MTDSMAREMKLMLVPNLYKNIHNSQKQKQPNCPSPVEWINKLARWYHSILDNSKEEQTPDTWNKMDESQIQYVKWKKPDSKDYIPWQYLHNILKMAKL